jgi:hypothetical protein
MHDSSPTLVRVLGAGRAGLGLAMVLAPRLVTRPWLGRDARRPATATVVRAQGIREVVLGALEVRAAADRSAAGGRFLQALAAVDAVDLAATYAARRALPRASTPLIAALAGTAIVVQLRAAAQPVSGPAARR